MFRLFKNWFSKDQYITVKAMIIKETDKALLVDFNNRREWLPKSWIKVTDSGIKIKKSLLEKKFS